MNRMGAIFPEFGLYCVTDPSLGQGRSHVEQARLCLEGGARVIQLRDKYAGFETLLPQARQIAALCHSYKALFIVNDDPRLAVESGADGVHVGQQDAAPMEARRVVGPDLLVGLSTNNRAQVLAAQNLPVDYIGFGPVFPTLTKTSEDEPLGAAEVEWAVHNSALPVVPIGGIGAQNLPSLLAGGARFAAVISAVVSAPDVAQAARALAALIAQGRGEI
jgi:thiamine-phosphate pyrophosphorylase